MQKLAACIAFFNGNSLLFVVQLGDLVEEDLSTYDRVLPIVARSRAPVYHLLGNHDFEVSNAYKHLIPAKLGLRERYYNFVPYRGWRCVFLDGTQYGLFSTTEGTPERARYDDIVRHLRSVKAKNIYDWNGALGATQLSWLRTVLAEAHQNREKVLLFCHFPCYPIDGPHNLLDCTDLSRLIRDFPCVAAYFNGHDHPGSYGLEQNAHFVNFKAMVTTADENAHALVEVYDSKIVIIGGGREESRTLQVRG